VLQTTPPCSCGAKNWTFYQVVRSDFVHISVYECECLRMSQFTNAGNLGLFLVPRGTQFLDSDFAEQARNKLITAWKFSRKMPRDFGSHDGDIYVTDHVNIDLTCEWHKI